MATVAAIQKDATNFFANFSEEQKKQQIKSFEYVLQLAGLTNTNISKWDVSAIFGTGTGNYLVTDKREINKRFMERIHTTTEATPTVEKALEQIEAMPQVANALNQFGLSYIEAEKRRIKEDLDYKANNLKQAFQRVDNSIKEVTQARQKLEALDGKNPAESLKRELAEVLAEGCWVNPVVEEGHLYLNTKNNVTISYKNKMANVDIDVNCGMLAIKIRISDMNLWVIPYKNNIRSRDFYHPHVNTEGGICWGDARNQVTNWIAEGKIGSILKLLYSLLFNYNDGNPYEPIQNFKNNSTKYGAIRDVLKHPDRRRKPTAEDLGPLNPNPTFNVGDRVACAERSGWSEPQWDYAANRNTNGVMLHGTVREVNNTTHRLAVQFDNGMEWTWPIEGNSEYSPDQWTRPGYIRALVETPDEEE